jgi:DNA-binding transcriptional ArsR family regulator
MSRKAVLLSDQMIELVARRFRVLGEPQRLRILQLLEAGERTVGDIVEALDGNQPNVSKHLQSLYESGLVGRRRNGNSIYYSIADPVVFKLCTLVCRSAAQDARERLDSLTAVLPRKTHRG